MASKKRLVRLTQELTGLQFTAAYELAKRHLVTWRQPVPDPATHAQRSLEARILYSLIAEYPENAQPAGRPLGLEKVLPTAHGIDLVPTAGEAERVLHAVVPRYDPDFGGLRGAAGVRAARIDRDWWTLHDVAGNASVRLRAPRSLDPINSRHPRHPHMPILKGITKSTLTRLEKQEQAYEARVAAKEQAGWLAHRNLLLSRLLRRPLLFHAITQGYGAANIYQHFERDVVFEWCCGPTEAEFAQLATRSGLLAGAADVPSLLHPANEGAVDAARGHMRVGTAVMCYRRNPYLGHAAA